LLQNRWNRKDFTDQQWAETLAELRQHEVWNVVPPEQPYGDLNTLLQAEIGRSLPEATATVKAYMDHGGDRRSQQFQDNNCNLEKPTQGNSPRYLRQRLKKEYPDIYAALERKEYRSPYAAAKAAGFVRDATALQLLKRAWDKASPEERRRFAREVVTSEEDREMLMEELACMKGAD